MAKAKTLKQSNTAQSGSELSEKLLPSMRNSQWLLDLPRRILNHMDLLCDSRVESPQFNKVTRLQHCLLTATLAHQAGRDDEYVVCCLVHDIGDLLAPYNHGEFAAALLQPFISEKNHWMVANHQCFQGYYYFHHLGLDRNMRDQHRGHPHFDYTLDFIESFDMPAFNPDLDYMPLEKFEPILSRVLCTPKHTIYLQGN